jgi:hypothetical protein
VEQQRLETIYKMMAERGKVRFKKRNGLWSLEWRKVLEFKDEYTDKIARGGQKRGRKRPESVPTPSGDARERMLCSDLVCSDLVCSMGKEPEGGGPKPPADRSSSPAALLVSRWNDQKDTWPIAQDKGVRLVEAALAQGATFRQIEDAFMDGKRVRGRKIWSVLEEIAPRRAEAAKGKPYWLDQLVETIGGDGAAPDPGKETQDGTAKAGA